MSDQPLVSFSIVSWNVRELLWSCLTSVERYVSQPHEIIVVDNASTDATVEMVKRDFPDVRLIANPNNRGFAAANNQALAQARGKFLVLLNPDTEITGDFLTPLIEYLTRHADCAAVAPEILNVDRSHQQSVRNFPTAADQVMVLLKLRHFFSGSRTMRRYLADPGAGQHQPLSVDQVMGACIVIPREKLDLIGGFDEGYWIWFEEVDWCQRAHRAGYSVVYHPGSQVIHRGGQSFHQVVSFKKQVWFIRSLQRYAHKYWSRFAQWAIAAVIPLNLLLSGFQTLLIRY